MIAPVILSAVSIWATGHPVPFTCEPPQGWSGGHATLGEQPPHVWLSPNICRDIGRGNGEYVWTVLHELGHTTGLADERQPTCFANRRLRAALRRFWHFKPRTVEREYRAAMRYVRGFGPDYNEGRCNA